MHHNNNEEAANKYFLPAAVIIAGLFVAGAVLWSGSHPTGTTNGPETAKAPKVDIKDIKTEGNPFIGKADAPITIAFWSDFQCPFCKAAEVGGIPQIPTPAAFPEVIKNYVDTGKVKVVFFDFTFLGNDSVTAAIYNRAVWKLYPEKYFEWRTAMYKAQDEEGDKGFGNAATIDKLTATIAGIDATKVAADVKANTATYQAFVDADKAQALKSGINATPAFVIGKQVILGAYPYARFQEVIEEALK
jgi:protein-disulfide isomerase